jgi:hypothetical protein
MDTHHIGVLDGRGQRRFAQSLCEAGEAAVVSHNLHRHNRPPPSPCQTCDQASENKYPPKDQAKEVPQITAICCVPPEYSLLVCCCQQSFQGTQSSMRMQVFIHTVSNTNELLERLGGARRRAHLCRPCQRNRGPAFLQARDHLWSRAAGRAPAQICAPPPLGWGANPLQQHMHSH